MMLNGSGKSFFAIMFATLVSWLLLCLSRPHCSFMGMMISHDMLLGRWRLSLELFGRVFMEDVGAEPGSVCSYLIVYIYITNYLHCTIFVESLQLSMLQIDNEDNIKYRLNN